MHSINTLSNMSNAEELYEDSRSKLSLSNHDLQSRLVLYMAVALMAIIIIVGGIGNTMVILAVRTTKKLQTASNAFVVNLSACDLVFVIIILPFNIYTYLTDGWDLPQFLCKIIGFLGYTLTGTTIITITMIAWNRYRLVVDPQTYHRLFNRHHLAAMLTLAWVLPAACLIPALLEVWGKFGYVTMMVTCNLLLDHGSQSFKLFLLIVRAVIPCFLILFYYTSIYRATKASHRRVMSRRLLASAFTRMDQAIQRKEMHLTKMMATIFIVFALSYFPCTISSIVDWNTVLSKRFHMFCLITVYVGSAINPLIYGLMNSQFRCAYYSILLCRCCFSARDGAVPSDSSSITKRKKHKRGNEKKELKAPTKKLPDQHPPAIISNNHIYSPVLPEPSDENCPFENNPAKTEATCRKRSIQSTDSTPSSQDSDEYCHQNLHRTETEKTCLGDCGIEPCLSHIHSVV